MKVSSEFEFPELYPFDFSGQSDLLIRFGNIPEIPKESTSFNNDFYDIGQDVFRITIQGVGSYYVKNGNEIIISPQDSADHDNIRIFCLSNAFAAVLHQQKKIPLHCAAVLINERLMLIFGNSGAGKSSTLGALIQRGYTVFSDDVCVPVDISTGQMKLFSSYPLIKFWRNTIENLDMGSKVDRRIRPGIEKYGIYFHKKFITEPKSPFLTIILEESTDVIVPDIHKIEGIDAFQRLREHAYRSEYLLHSGLGREQFNIFTKLAAQTKLYVIRRPKDRNSIQEIVNLTEKIIVSE